MEGRCGGGRGEEGRGEKTGIRAGARRHEGELRGTGEREIKEREREG